MVKAAIKFVGVGEANHHLFKRRMNQTSVRVSYFTHPFSPTGLSKFGHSMDNNGKIPRDLSMAGLRWLAILLIISTQITPQTQQIR